MVHPNLPLASGVLSWVPAWYGLVPACGLVALPHVLYALVWLRPDVWMRVFGRNNSAVKALSSAAHVLKAIQFAAAVTFYMVHDLDTDKLAWPWVSGVYRRGQFLPGPNPWLALFRGRLGPQRLLPGLAGVAVGVLGLGMAAYGQTLNAAVFAKLGETGTYYGCRFGEKVPWVEGFPFNHVSHAQYLGSVLTVWAPLLVLADYCDLWVIGKLCLFWSACYLTTAVVEDTGSHEPHEFALRDETGRKGGPRGAAKGKGD